MIYFFLLATAAHFAVCSLQSASISVSQNLTLLFLRLRFILCSGNESFAAAAAAAAFYSLIFFWFSQNFFHHQLYYDLCVCAVCECFVKLLLCCSLSVVLSYFVGSSGFVVSIFLFFTKT